MNSSKTSERASRALFTASAWLASSRLMTSISGLWPLALFSQRSRCCAASMLTLVPGQERIGPLNLPMTSGAESVGEHRAQTRSLWGTGDCALVQQLL